MKSRMENKTKFYQIQSFLKSWKEDYRFQTLSGSAFSFAVTIIFALYNGFLGIRLRSIWHGGICVFYLLLAVIRGMILTSEKKNRTKDDQQKSKSRRRVFLISTIFLLLLNLSLILPVSLMVLLKKPVNMGLVPAITMATYTTYKITMASIHFRKQKHNPHILIVELRTINFIDALVSILTLQNTLIMVNQVNSTDNKMLIVSSISSAVIYIIIIFVTVRLLKRGLKKA